METKICTRCDTEKPLFEYHSARSNKDGKQTFCKKCDNKRKTDTLRRKSIQSGSTRQFTLVARELRAQGLKRCSVCKEVKEFQSFYRHKNTVDGYAHCCAICVQKLGVKYYTPEKGHAKYQRNKRTQKNAKLLKDFGITIDQYEEMLSTQCNLCAICNEPSPGKALAVDHDHDTGQVRALLCGNCNPAVGFVKEKPSRARAIAEYLEKYGKIG
jgi:hypothetical protein